MSEGAEVPKEEEGHEVPLQKAELGANLSADRHSVVAQEETVNVFDSSSDSICMVM